MAQRGAGACECRVGARAGPAAIAAVTAWPVATRPPLAGGARETLGAPPDQPRQLRGLATTRTEKAARDLLIFCRPVLRGAGTWVSHLTPAGDSVAHESRGPPGPAHAVSARLPHAGPRRPSGSARSPSGKFVLAVYAVCNFSGFNIEFLFLRTDK